MGKKKTPAPFVPGFVCLAPSIYVQDAKLVGTNPPYPQQQQQQQDQRPPFFSFSSASSSPLPLPAACEATTQGAPDLIIITSWTGAIPKHIAKYTLSYNQLYPGTPLMVITTTISDLAFHTLETKIRALAPAAKYLLDKDAEVADNKSKTTEILLHAFSEGGAHKAVCLARAYQRAPGRSTDTNGTTTAARRLPVAAFVLDSAPGLPRYTSNVAAFRRSLPRNAVAQALGVPVGVSVVGVTWVLFSVFVGFDNNLISQTRRALNDEALWRDVRAAPRTYLFSERDDLIRWRDVERHGVESADALGVRSLLVRFRDSGHCGHARGNEGVYWGAVRRTWEARPAAADAGRAEEGGQVAGCGGVGEGGDGGDGRGDVAAKRARKHPVLTCVCCGEKLED